MRAKSFISLKKTVVLTTRSRLAAGRFQDIGRGLTNRLASLRFHSALNHSYPVAWSMPNWPEVYSK